LWIEVPEYGAFRNFDAFASFCNSLAPLGCKIGIEHFGRHFGEIAKLAELGLDYLKVDSSYIRDIQDNNGNQSFLKGLCQMAHTVGILVIAEGVMQDAERDTLVAIGFDGITGQAVRRPDS
ncbi:MAG: EAL domain-containing protein, partial [Sterolibacterium sp.]|nr:EAL domain-containing protein [Sterolibacterium sp.]